MRKLFVISCIISILFVLGTFTYSRWSISRFTDRFDKDTPPNVVENTTAPRDNVVLDSSTVPPDDTVEFAENEPINLDLDNLDPDAFAAVGIDIEGLTEVEILKAVVAELEESVRWSKNFLAERAAFDRRTEEFERQQQEATAELARLKAEIAKLNFAEIDSFRKQFLPDSYHFDWDRDRELRESGLSPDEVRRIMIAETFGPHQAEMDAKFEALFPDNPSPPLRPGGLPPEEFDPNDPRRARFRPR